MGSEVMLVLDHSKGEELVRALSDDYSRKIILAIMSKAQPIEEISREQGIPISTCYRRVHDLLVSGIVKPDKTIILEDGKKYISYKAAFKNATINLDSSELSVVVVLNKEESSTPFETPQAERVEMQKHLVARAPLIHA
jgi:DNA-binding Lrp family transcriptional regulator